MKKLYFLLALMIAAATITFNCSAQNATIYVIGGSATFGQYGGDGDTATDPAVFFNNPSGAWPDTAGNLYIYDAGNARVRKINAVTHIVTTIAGNGTAGFSGDGGPAPLAELAGGIGDPVYGDNLGNIFLADITHIRKINTINGIITTVAGNGSSGSFWDADFGDGGPATAAEINGMNGLYVDASENIYLTDNSNSIIRKIDGATGIITTIAGNGSGGFAGDGGPATDAQISGPVSITGDAAGNIYFSDLYNNRIRKITPSGIITTVAGNGSQGFNGDGGLAVNAMLNQPYGICADSAGNVLFNDGAYAIRKIDVTTGIINTIAGNIEGSSIPNFFNATSISAYSTQIDATNINCDRHGNIYYADNFFDDYILKITNAASVINTLSYSDSLATPSCTLPATIATGVYGTINGTPASTDSVTVSVNYGQFLSTPVNYTLPYWSAGAYGFGSTSNSLGSFSYSIPGIYTPVITITTLDGFTEVENAPTITVGSMCDSSVTGIAIDAVQDTISTLPCSLPANVRLSVSGHIAGTPGPADSAYIVYQYNNTDPTFQIHVVPYVLTAGVYTFTDTNNRIYAPMPSYSPYMPQVFAVTSSGMYTTGVVPLSAFTIDSCNGGGISVYPSDTAYYGYYIGNSICYVPFTDMYNVGGYLNDYADTATTLSIFINFTDGTDTTVTTPVYTDGLGNYSYSVDFAHTYYAPNTYMPLVAVQGAFPDTAYAPQLIIDTACYISAGITDTSGTDIGCAMPYTDQYFISGSLQGYADTETVLSISVNFGDGTDTIFTVPVNSDYSFSANSFTHTYTTPGSYATVAAITAGSFTDTTTAPMLTLGTSCSPLTGILYIDANGNCVFDTGEITLGYWPYTLVNNTTEDTTYGWCDNNGYYSLQVVNSDSYTMIADPFGGGYGGSALFASCPATGIDTFTAIAGSALTQNFAFSCAPPTNMDMNISGWGWGFVPGDTGIIGVWSSNYWGYMCDTLSSTITLTIDPLLTYIGMWDGPVPSGVVGNTLTWTFSTQGDLFDFSGDVKVVCSTSAPYGSSVCNTLYVSPTTIPDPDTANNTYYWCEPVNSSWDPNEKQVSPRGSGPQGYIANGTPLSYIIHFQNTGTAPAHNITVMDTINSNLDISTLQVINSSAPVLTYQVADNVIGFRFNNINLPDSTVSHLGSIGYISYNILPINGLPHETQITNKANIYFDYNPAVATNTTLNTISAVGVITGPASVCAGAAIALTDTITGGVWNVSNGNASVANGMVTGVTPGIDTISYTSDGMTISTTITVTALPAAGVITGYDTVCTGSSITLADNAPGGLWHANNSNLNIVNGVATGVSPGTDTVSYSVNNACGTATASKIITVTLCNLGIANTTYNALEVYPNPASDVLTIKMNAGAYTTFTITNNIGQTIIEQPINGTLTNVDIKRLPAGVYYINLRADNGNNTVRKFVKM